jgi:hypothetical protein
MKSWILSLAIGGAIGLPLGAAAGLVRPVDVSDAVGMAIAVPIMLLLLAVALVVFWLPTWVAISRGHSAWPLVAFVNLFFGLTVIGWVFALALALSGGQPAGLTGQADNR